MWVTLRYEILAQRIEVSVPSAEYDTYIIYTEKVYMNVEILQNSICFSIIRFECY